jgi:hypothetical protein
MARARHELEIGAGSPVLEAVLGSPIHVGRVVERAVESAAEGVAEGVVERVVERVACTFM